jgi:hypothetical protein
MQRAQDRMDIPTRNRRAEVDHEIKEVNVRRTKRKVIGILTVRGVSPKMKRELYAIAEQDGYMTLSVLIRKHLMKLIASRRKAA